ncbi:unnamed protein product, partial [Symbiodinium pilosum]
LCLHRVDGQSVLRLSLIIEALQSFKGVTEIFPHVQELSFRGEWACRGGKDALRDLMSWQASLRSLTFDIVAGTMRLHSSSLERFKALEEVRLHLHASRRDLVALGGLVNLRQLVFWGTDENTTDADLVNKAFGVLDLSSCRRLRVLAFRSMSFCHPEEQDHQGCMALAFPSSLEEMVVVNDIDPLSGLTPKLRHHIRGRPIHLAEYARSHASCHGQERFKLICTETQMPGTPLWELDSAFCRQTPEEIEERRLSHLQLLNAQ